MDMPGYITAYKDNEGNVCLYMFPGLLDNQCIYQYINEETLSNFSKTIYEDSSVLYTFKHKPIKHINACLISNFKDKIPDKTIYITL